MSDGYALWLHEEDNSLVDYKFFCIDGEPSLLYISKGLENHSKAEISFYDMKGKEMPFHRRDFSPYHNAELPCEFEWMKSIASRIAKAIESRFSRIDLYSINDNIYFSEITFCPCSGLIPFEPSEADLELGELLCVDSHQVRK